MMSLKLVAFLLLAGASYFVSSKQVVEVYFIVEPSVIKNYRTLGYSQSDAITNIRSDLKYYVHQVNELYKSMRRYGLDIEIRQKKLKIMDKSGEEMFEDCILIRHKLLQSDMAIEVFKVWLEDTKASQNVGYDIAVVLTGFDLFGSAGDTGVAGYATIKATCNPKQAVSVVEFDGTYSTAETLAHEIGHSLGANHDSTNECHPQDGYIMSPNGDPRHKHRWEFSACSAREIRTYINSLNSKNNNCLMKTTTPATKFSLSTQVDLDIFDPQKICERKNKNKESFLCRSRNLYNNREPKGDAICKMLFCDKADTSGMCATATPSEGMPCDVGKRCQKGRCINMGIRTPKLLRKDCLFGEDKKIRYNGKRYSCGQLMKEVGADTCYSDYVTETCCETCEKNKKGPKDCLYGDAAKIEFMNREPTTCTKYIAEEGSMACYGDFIQKRCCATCEKLKTGHKGCEYGEHKSCASYKDDPSSICYNANNIEYCCIVCRDYGRKRSIYHDNSVSLVSNITTDIPLETDLDLNIQPQQEAEEEPRFYSLA